jgi:hypothetical protein
VTWLTALDDPSFYQQPRCAADGSDDLLLVVEGAYELQHLVVDAQKVGIDLPAREDDRLINLTARSGTAEILKSEPTTRGLPEPSALKDSNCGNSKASHGLPKIR